jgi:hypothetical protein
MRGKFERLKFIQILEDTPFISYAAKKSGVAKATIYRWMKSDSNFQSAVDLALESGRRHLSDIAEMALTEKIKSKDLGAIKFYLQNNNKRYRPVRTTYIPPELDEKRQNCDECELREQKDKVKKMGYKEVKQYLVKMASNLGLTVIDEEENTDIDWMENNQK